eukprot:TRINITY_DN36285_c0_g1_i1.p1 TRINITY_DN36285_c0_g1~~TRINITY_DN36285_c0_g1_i1.p1  ORF type:complete len:244 (-),score=66.64 TRINITY_DN36285_c0_g1_i1:98-751(-)
MLNPTEPRLTPVPETDEAYDSILHVLHVARKNDLAATYNKHVQRHVVDRMDAAVKHAQQQHRNLVDAHHVQRIDVHHAASAHAHAQNQQQQQSRQDRLDAAQVALTQRREERLDAHAQRMMDAHAHHHVAAAQRLDREEKMKNRGHTALSRTVSADPRSPEYLHPDINHKRLIRSASHRPDLDVKNKFGGKQPLRKYHSFPYKVFVNDTGYSSDDSI